MELPGLLVLLAAFLVGMAKGGLATLGTLAVPMLALKMDPLEAAALLLPVYIVSDAVGVWLFRREYDRRNLVLLIPSGIAGVAIASALATFLPAEVFLVATGLIGIAYCARAWFGAGRNAPPRPADTPRGIFWGAMTGISSFVSHSGGPPFQTYVLPQQLPKMVFAGTSTITFAAINLAKLPGYWGLGLFHAVEPATLGVLILTAITGTYAGNRVTRMLPERTYVLFIQTALFLLSLRLVWDGIRSLI